MVTFGGKRPRRLGGDAVTFEDMRKSPDTYSDYEQQMHITNQDGGDGVLARRPEPVGLATQMMVANEFYHGKPWVDLSESKGLLALMCSRRMARIFAGRYSVC